MPNDKRSESEPASSRPHPPRTAPARLLAAIISILVAPQLGGCEREANPLPEMPHVVVYLIDTLRRDRLGAYGYDRPTSPTIDALARESIVCEKATAAAPWTLPSVVSLMTSRHANSHGVVARGQTLDENMPTLVSRLRRRGYRTAGFVANPLAASAAGLDPHYDHLVEKKGAKVGSDFRTDIESFLEKRQDERLFLYIHTIEPHRPYRPGREHLSRVGEITPDAHRGIHKALARYRSLTRKETSTPARYDRAALRYMANHLDSMRTLYDAEVLRADIHLAAILKLLERFGIWDETLLVVLSDHGEEFLEHGGLLHGQSLYAELLDVPLLWRLPGGLHGGRRLTQPVSLLDVQPTLLAAVGALDDPTLSQGRNLLPILLGDPEVGDAAATPRPIAVRIEEDFPGLPARAERGDNNVALLVDGHKAIWNADLGSLELYYGAQDAEETTDISDRRPELVSRAAHFAETWWRESNAKANEAPEPREARFDEDTAERLRALGYVE